MYGAARMGEPVVNRRLSPTWAIVVLGVAALALAGCGRKGGLDLPPTAASASTANSPPPDSQGVAASKPSVFNSSYGANAPPSAARGSKQPFILDPLLDDKPQGH